MTENKQDETAHLVSTVTQKLADTEVGTLVSELAMVNEGQLTSCCVYMCQHTWLLPDMLRHSTCMYFQHLSSCLMKYILPQKPVQWKLWISSFFPLLVTFLLSLPVKNQSCTGLLSIFRHIKITKHFLMLASTKYISNGQGKKQKNLFCCITYKISNKTGVIICLCIEKYFRNNFLITKNH